MRNTKKVLPLILLGLSAGIAAADLTENNRATLTRHTVGAQQMAGQDGMTFDQIIAFYFPGSELLKYTGETAPLPTPSGDLQVTPAPPAAEATPKPTLMPVTTGSLPEDAYLAEVAHIDDDSTLNLRKEPSPVAGIIMRLYKYQKLVVLDELDVPGWAHVQTDSVDGYVMTSFLEKITE